MARFFREQDIDEFRDCFYLNARSGQIRSLDELTIIMRSLGMSPTITELKKYFKEKNGKISFADMLEIMHNHSQKENIPQEILRAFRASDKTKSGRIPARELRHILLLWGEKLSPKEVLRWFDSVNESAALPYSSSVIHQLSDVDRIFREANVSPNGYVNYDDFVRVVCAPVPDYY